jgi:hypothetical protein
LEGKEVKMTPTNLTGLERFCEKFGFTEFSGKLSELRPSMSFEEAENADAYGRIAALEENANQQNRAICGFAGQVEAALHKFSTPYR